jgi:carbon-monoxide dehydrogenase large subunit
LRANAPATELRLADGKILRPDGSTVMALAEAITACGGRLAETGAQPRSFAFPSGCHIAEVEIDPETGSTRLLSYVAADDAGVILNPVAAEGQIHGGIVQGLGEVFGEAIVTDADGQVLTASFMDYGITRAEDVPAFVTLDLPVPSPHNPLGVKGLGEAGTTGALAAASNAIADALASAGAAMADLPCTPERLWRAITEARGPK